MTLVERAHQPRTWNRFQASRRQYGDIVSEIARVVGNEITTEPEVEIEVTAYERPFASVEELLENVEEREWRDLDEVHANIRDPEPQGLRVSVDVSRQSGVRLALRGANRRSRNAIEPDVVAAIERRISQQTRSNTGRSFVWPWRLLAVIVAVPPLIGAVIEFNASNRTGLNNYDSNAALYSIGWFFAAALLSMLSLAMGSITLDRIRGTLPNGEFLPDDEQTAWDAWQLHAGQRFRLAGRLLSAAASVATIATLVIVLGSSTAQRHGASATKRHNNHTH